MRRRSYFTKYSINFATKRPFYSFVDRFHVIVTLICNLQIPLKRSRGTGHPVVDTRPRNQPCKHMNNPLNNIGREDTYSVRLSVANGFTGDWSEIRQTKWKVCKVVREALYTHTGIQIKDSLQYLKQIYSLAVFQGQQEGVFYFARQYPEWLNCENQKVSLSNNPPCKLECLAKLRLTLEEENARRKA